MPPLVKRLVAAAGCAAVIVGSALQACQTPVFRYALERWAPGNYLLLAYHSGPLASNHVAMVNALREASIGGRGQANFVVEEVAVTTETRADILKLWQAQTNENPNATMPWLMVRYPLTEDS